MIVAPFYAGMATFTMTSIPGSPQIQNVIPTTYIGTTMTAAPVLGICCAVAFIIFELIYFRYAEKKAVVQGEGFELPLGLDATNYNVDQSALPPAITAFIPLCACFGIIMAANLLSLPISQNSTKLCCLSMIVAALLALILNSKYISDSKGTSKVDIIKANLGTAALNATSAFAGLAALVGFGSVVSSTEAFTNVVQWLIALDMSPYWKGIFSTGVISGIAASGSAGLRLTYQNLSEYFVNSGCDLSILHRLTVIACGTLDSLPHVSGLPVVFGVLGLTHKEAYKHVFWISVAIPTVIVIGATAVVTLLGL